MAGTRSQAGRGRMPGGRQGPRVPTMAAGRGELAKPRGLEKDVAAAWDELAGLLAPILDLADAPMIEAGATALAMVRRANAAWKAQPDVLVEDRFGQMKANPVIAVQTNALTQWRQFATELGVGPAARARLAGLAVAGREPEDDFAEVGGLVALMGGKQAS